MIMTKHFSQDGLPTSSENWNHNHRCTIPKQLHLQLLEGYIQSNCKRRSIRSLSWTQFQMVWTSLTQLNLLDIPKSLHCHVHLHYLRVASRISPIDHSEHTHKLFPFQVTKLVLCIISKKKTLCVRQMPTSSSYSLLKNALMHSSLITEASASTNHMCLTKNYDLRICTC